MIDLKDFVRPPVLLALAGSAAVGFAAGYLLGRDPRLMRRVLAAAAQSWEQTRLAVAEAREDLADQWAEATESARHDIEKAAFAAGPVAVAGAAATITPAPAAAVPEAAARARRTKRSRASTPRRARPSTTH
jgi:hypothetical protein